MDDVIERLRASEREFASAMFEQGREAGEEWAKRSAEAVELRSLQRAWDSRDRSNSEPGNWLYWGDQNPPPSNQFWNIIEEVAQHADARDFWIAVTNEEESLADEIEFVHGFAAGALNVWSEVKDKI